MAEGSADLTISKSVLLPLSHHNFSNTHLHEKNFMESFLNYLASGSKNNMVDLLPWYQHITVSWTYNSVKMNIIKLMFSKVI